MNKIKNSIGINKFKKSDNDKVIVARNPDVANVVSKLRNKIIYLDYVPSLDWDKYFYQTNDKFTLINLTGMKKWVDKEQKKAGQGNELGWIYTSFENLEGKVE